MHSKKNISVLLVEDNDDEAYLIQDLLEERYQYERISDGLEAFEYLTKTDDPPDVVLMDYRLPSMNGLEIMQGLFKERDDLAFIFLTVDERIETAIEAMKEGALDFHPKMNGISVLPDKINRVYDIHRNKIEKKRLQEEIRLKEEIYRLTIERTGQISYCFDPDTGRVKWQGAFEKLSGYSEDEFLSFNLEEWADHIHPEDRERVLETVEKAVSEHTIFEEEYRFKRKDGTYIYVEEHGAWLPERTKDGYSCVGVIKDITERKTSEHSLEESEKKYRYIIENSIDGLGVGDLNGNIVEVNDSLCEMLGYSREELLELNINDIEYKEAPEETVKHYRKIIEKGYDSFESILKRKDGKPVEVIATARYYDEKELIYGFFKDITSMKDSERALRESRENYRALADNSNDLIVRVDRECRHLYVNPIGVEAFKIPTEKIIGKTLDEIEMPVEEVGKLKDAVKTVFESKKPYRIDIELLIDEEIRFFDLVHVPEFGMDREVNSVLITSRDITEIKKADYALRESESRFRSLFEQSPFGILYCKGIKDKNEKISDFMHLQGNEAVEKHTGFKLDKIIGKSALEMSRGKEIKDVIDKYANMLSSGKSIDYIQYFELYNKTLQVTVAPVDEEYFIINFADISELVKAEDELRKVSSFNQTLLDSSPDVIYVYDLEKKNNVYSNERIIDIAGYTPEEIKKMGDRLIQDLMHPDDFKIYINKAIKSYNQVKDGEILKNTYRMKHKNGNWLWLDFRETIFKRNNKGEPVLIFGMITDITEKKKAEERLKVANENIQRQNQILLNMNRLFVESFDCNNVSEAAEICLNIALEATDSQYGAVAEVNKNNRYDILALSDMGWEECLIARDQPDCIRDLEVGGIWNEAFNHEKGLIVNDPGNHPLSVGVPEGHLPINSFLGVPFKHKKFKGMIGIANKECGFTETDRKIIESLSLAFAEVLNSKRAEEEINKQKNMLELIINTVPSSIYWKDLNSVYLGCNNTFARDTGIKDPVEVIGKNDSELIWSEVAEKFRADDKLVMDTGNPKLSFEENVITAAGKEKWVISNKIPLKDTDGRIFGVLGTAEDITEKKQAEEALKESEEKLRLITDASADLISMFDLNGMLLFINSAGAEMYGYERDQMYGMQMDEFLSEKRLKEADKLFKRVIQRGKEVRGEIYVKHKKGFEFPIAYSVAPLRKDGDNIGFTCSASDITERKKAEIELRESEENLKMALDITKAGIWRWELEKNEVFYDERTHELLGYKFGEMFNTFEDAVELHHPEDIDGMMKKVNDYLEGRLSEYNTEHRMRHKDGSWRWINGRGKVIEWKDNKPVLLTGSLFDITERKNLEEQLQIRQRMDSLGTLAGGIAHDFNNILVGIMGNIDYLSRTAETFTEDQKNCIKDAFTSCDRAAGIIRQFQTLSKATVHNISSIDLYEISKEVFDLIKETTDRLIGKKIKFSKGEYIVKANSTELHQVLLNLVTNSVQALEIRGLKKGDFIEIDAEEVTSRELKTPDIKEGDYIHVTFSDNGIGMSSEVISKAFDPMFTTKGANKRSGQGLGLAMVYNIVTKFFKGHIEIESESGVGTTFHIYLPRGITQIKDKTDDKEIRGGDETILIIDDEPNVIRAFHRMMGEFDYNVIDASNGLEGLEIYKKSRDSIDIVILDLMMPEMPGVETYEKLLQINPNVKVIISSGFGEIDAKKGILQKVEGFLSKPYKFEEAASIIRNVLDF